MLVIDPQDKLNHKIEAFQDYYVSSFNEGNLQSLLLVISALGASFMLLMRRPSCQFGCRLVGLHKAIGLV